MPRSGWAGCCCPGKACRSTIATPLPALYPRRPGGNPEAQNLLGRCHENGWGTKQDREAARRCYRAAAEAGDYRGAHNHACVLAAEGCIAGALHWFERAVAGAPPPARDAILLALRHHPRCVIRVFAESRT